MIEDVAKAIWTATEDGPWNEVGELGKRYVYCEAMAGLEATADWLEEKYGDLHPGCVAIRHELKKFNDAQRG